MHNSINKIKIGNTAYNLGDIFVAKKDVTTFAQITDAVNAGKIVVAKGAGNILYNLVKLTSSIAQFASFDPDSGLRRALECDSANEWDTSLEYEGGFAEQVDLETLQNNLGSAAYKDVPTSGNASSTQVVMGNDTRLSNARTPSSHTHGNIQNGGTLQTSDITIASGDKLVVTDSSDSNKVARASVSFDGSTTSKALTKKGTFEDFASPNDFTHLSDKGVLDLSSLNTDKWYPVLFRNYHSASTEKPSIIHTIVWVEFGTYTTTWSSHSNNSFSCYSEWKEWPANGGESQRIKYVENSYYHWTDKPPVVHRDSLDYGTFSVVYLRGGTKYNYVTVKGAEVLLKTSSYTENNITYSPLSYSDFTQYETSLGSKCIGTEGIACGKSFDKNNPWFIRQANFVNGLVSNNIMYFGQYADPLYINSADGGTSLDMRSSGGAIVTVRGTNHIDPGAFVLTAHSGSTYKQFRGGPDGSLTWDTERIPTSPDASVLKIVKLTQQQYDALTTKDSTTLYIIV